MRFMLAILITAFSASAAYLDNAAGWLATHPGGVYDDLIGDSTMAGYNFFTTGLDGGGVESGDTNCNQASLLISHGLSATNHAKSGATVSSVILQQLTNALARTGSNIWLRVGVNDIGAGHVWDDIASNMNFLATQCANSNRTLFLMDILPSSGLNAEKITWNTAKLAWVATNTTGVRAYAVSDYTNFLNSGQDAMHVLYTWDNVHLTPAGNFASAFGSIEGKHQELDPGPVHVVYCPVVRDRQTNSGSGSGGYKAIGDTTATKYWSTMFTCSNTEFCTSIRVPLRKIASPTGNITLAIHTNQTSLPTNILMTSSTVFNAATLPAAPTVTPTPYVTNCEFIVGVQLTSNVIYHISVGGIDISAVNYIGIQQSTDATKLMCKSPDRVVWTGGASANAMMEIVTTPCAAINGVVKITGKTTKQ